MSDKFLACIADELCTLEKANVRECGSTTFTQTTTPTKKRKFGSTSGATTTTTTATTDTFPVFCVHSSDSVNETKAIKDKDTSRTMRTKAEAIQALHVCQAQLSHSEQEIVQLRSQLSQACSKIEFLETKLHESREKNEMLMQNMLAKSETQIHLLWSQSAKITTQALNAVTSSHHHSPISVSPNVEKERESTDKYEGKDKGDALKIHLLQIRNDCQRFVPEIPSPETIHNREVQQKYRNAMYKHLAPFETQALREPYLLHLNSIFVKCQTLYQKHRPTLLQLCKVDSSFVQEQTSTELSLSCLQLALEILKTMQGTKTSILAMKTLV